MRRSIGAGIAALLLLAACGSNTTGATGSPSASPPAASESPSPSASTSASEGPSPLANCKDQTGAIQLTVEMKDFKFDPDCAKITGSQKGKFENKGNVPHTFTVVGTSIDVNLPPGQETSETLGLAPGVYTFYCKFHGAPDGSGMAGQLEVVA